MKPNAKFIVIPLWALAALAFLGGQAWAADSFEFTRETYDLIMRWVNFLILAGLMVKFARRPIISFLKDKRAEVNQTIQSLEESKRRVQEQIRESQAQLESGQERLSLIKERIIADGQRRKETLIAEAQNESALLMASAKHKIEALVRDASRSIRVELVDLAAGIALEKIPALLTPQDHDRLIHNWMEAAKR